MPNIELSLTDAICARSRPEDREYALRDLRQPGLALRVRPGGARTWVLRVREDRGQVRHSLGPFPDLSVKAARRAAAALLAAGVPSPASSPIGPLFEIFQKEHEARAGVFYKPAGLLTYQTYVRNRLLPAFAGKRVDAITRRDVVRWFEGYSLDYPGGANRALGILGHILGSAKAWGYLPKTWRNPVSGIRMNRRKVVGSFLSEEQMARLGIAFDATIARGCHAAALLRFLTLTGCRVSEAIGLEWRDVLPDCVRLRDSKTGPRDVILGAATRRFLRSQRARLSMRARFSGAPVFPLEGGQKYEAVRSVWFQLRKEAGLPATFRIHDLRHSFASHAIMSGETLFSTSRLLGHSRVQMTARYAHLADDALLAAAEKIGTLLLRQLPVRARATASPDAADTERIEERLV
jgi:integrase